MTGPYTGGSDDGYAVEGVEVIGDHFDIVEELLRVGSREAHLDGRHDRRTQLEGADRRDHSRIGFAHIRLESRHNLVEDRSIGGVAEHDGVLGLLSFDVRRQIEPR